MSLKPPPRAPWRLAALAGFVWLALAPATQAQTLIRDTEIEGTLRAYSEPIFVAAGLNAPDVTVQVVADRSLNAFVTNGQNVFLHTGLIMRAETPNQLKGVIAHEAGHIAGGHLARSGEAMQAAMTPAYVSIALGLIAIAAGAADAGSALIASSQQFALLSFLRFSQVQESAADQAAVTYLNRLGQSSMGLLEFFENFQYMEVMSEARREPWFRSHPLSTDRIEALRRRAEASPFRDAEDSPEALERFAMMRAKIQGFLYPAQQTFLKYPPTDQSLPARYARAIAAFRAPDLTTAVRETRALIEEHPENPYFQELLGQIYFENGRVADSIEPNRRAVALAPGQPLLQINLARSLIADEDPKGWAEAEQLLRAALRNEPQNAFAWRQLATLYDQRGEGGLARLAGAEEAYSVGDIVRAHQFASFAQEQLTRDTPQWRRASDIALITEPEAQRRMRREQREDRRRIAFAAEPIATRTALSAAMAGTPAAAQAAIEAAHAEEHGHHHGHGHGHGHTHRH